jgi:tungstate transport system ATP-binding protein
MQRMTVDTKIRKKVLNIDRFALKYGELAAVVGPNGAGKSTFLQAINLLKPCSGEMQLFGQAICDVDKTALRRRSALVFQEMLLLNDTVFNNVAMPLRFRGMRENEIKKKVYKALSDFSCHHLADRSARLLSGGEAQRVCIARALVTDPELLLLDEPSASLDVAMRGEMIEKIRQLAEARGISVILISHNFTDVLHFAERAVVMLDGSIVQDDRPEIIMRQPINEQVAKLVGMDNIIPCNIEVVEDKTFIRLPNGVKFLSTKEVSESSAACCLCGDVLHIYDESSFPIEQKSWVVIEVLVERILPDVGSYRILVKWGEQTLSSRVPRNNLVGNVHSGDRIKLAFDPADAHYI